MTANPKMENNREHRGDSHEPSRRLALLAMAWMFLYGAVGTGLVGPNRPAVEKEFGLSHGQFGLALAVIQIACALGALSISMRLRQFDRAGALKLSLLLQTLGFAGVFLFRDPIGTVAGWTLITLGAVVGFVSNSLSARMWPDDPRKGVLLLHGLDGTGKVAGPILAAVCLSIGWRWSFLTVGAATAGLLALSLTVRKRAPMPAPTVPLESTEGQKRAPSLIWTCLIPFALMTGANVSFAAMVPTYCQSALGLDARTSSLLLSLHVAGLALGRFVLFSLPSRPSPNRVIGICLVMGLFVLLLRPGVPFPWVAVALFGVGGMFSGVWPTYYSRVSPHYSRAPHLLDYSSALGAHLGSSIAILLSGILAEHSLFLSIAFGPALMGLFGWYYFASPLSRDNASETPESDP